MTQSDEDYQEQLYLQAKIDQHTRNQMSDLREGGHNMLLGVDGTGCWHTNRCSNLDELDESFDDGSYYES